jgi:hypothetical protein
MLTKVLRVTNQSGLDTSDTRTGKLVTVLRGLALALLAVLIAAPGCGSNGDEAQPSATDVEQTVKDQLSTEGQGRVVDLGEPPRLVRCTKDANRQNGWRCTVTPTTGKNVLCLVDVDRAGNPVKTVCGPIDN